HVLVVPVHLSLFVAVATIFSNIQKSELNVENKNNNTNKSKYNPPNGICLNTAVNTTKTRPGPASGSKPKPNTAGKIASPARNEIKIFIVTIVKANFGKSSCLDKEEL